MSDLSIPIETPAVSMTQDDMKTKLASSNPAKLYQMFLEVTGLKQSWESIVTTVTEIKSTSKAFKPYKAELQQRKADMDRARTLCNSFERVCCEGACKAQAVDQDAAVDHPVQSLCNQAAKLKAVISR